MKDRSQEIKEASLKYYPAIYTGAILREAFRQGALWADKNSKQ